MALKRNILAASKYILKITHANTRKVCEKCLRVTIMAPERRRAFSRK